MGHPSSPGRTPWTVHKHAINVYTIKSCCYSYAVCIQFTCNSRFGSSGARVLVLGRVASPMFRRLLSTTTGSRSRLPHTIRQLLASSNPSTSLGNVQVSGWIKSIRRQKRVAFAVLTDGSSVQGLQAVFSNPDLAKTYVSSLLKAAFGILMGGAA
jgi:hypothetical protein